MNPPAPRRLTVFALTRGGAVTARRAAEVLGADLRLPQSLEAEASGAGDHEASEASGLGVAPGAPAPQGFARVGPALREAFTDPETAGLVCVMATGVVVRSLAPVIADKRTDPAVLVVDELGRFVIPLLSGHVGGANALAQYLARELGAQAVLTTASDVLGLLGPDLLARDLDAHIVNPAALLPVTAALVNHGRLDLWFDEEELGGAAAALRGLEGYEARPLAALPAAVGGPGVVVTTRKLDQGSPRGLLRLVPRWVTAGMGCKRGMPADRLVASVEEALEGAGRERASLRLLASGRIKEDEPGLLQAATRLEVPVVFAADADLAEQIARGALEESAFVREQAGVGAVCEPAALWAAGEGARLLSGKRAVEGTTVALALMDGGRVFQSKHGRWR